MRPRISPVSSTTTASEAMFASGARSSRLLPSCSVGSGATWRHDTETGWSIGFKRRSWLVTMLTTLPPSITGRPRELCCEREHDIADDIGGMVIGSLIGT